MPTFGEGNGLGTETRIKKQAVARELAAGNLGHELRSGPSRNVGLVLEESISRFDGVRPGFGEQTTDRNPPPILLTSDRGAASSQSLGDPLLRLESDIGVVERGHDHELRAEAGGTSGQETARRSEDRERLRRCVIDSTSAYRGREP